MLGLMHRVCAG